MDVDLDFGFIEAVDCGDTKGLSVWKGRCWLHISAKNKLICFFLDSCTLEPEVVNGKGYRKSEGE